MNDEQKYKKFAFSCVDSERTVTFNGHSYRAVGVAYRKNYHTKTSCLSVELADLNGCNSMITVGVEEFYKENNIKERTS